MENKTGVKIIFWENENCSKKFKIIQNVKITVYGNDADLIFSKCKIKNNVGNFKFLFICVIHVHIV